MRSVPMDVASSFSTLAQAFSNTEDVDHVDMCGVVDLGRTYR
jgi:hypothetical protein